ncbi:ankyrin repeat domain-containing protein 13B [Caerostris darwini]|uniref:Ankyrin repeat domain-containing protein 13B n=1 Tax=Caerostris darwini TaxID=1538125 RepID=A0AAV4P4L5_9ARAC|nr:ankyrin repeat domain-containing protein 13B [Caerostris darwini]
MLYERIRREYPLHLCVWHNDYKELEKYLQSSEHDIEKKDPRGRTPLMLAVTLNHLESARILLRHGADVIIENRQGYTIVHEAVSTENAQLLQEVLEKRDFQRYSTRAIGIPDLLSKIQSTPDFYVEIRWEFNSWVPLLSRLCPSDTYKVYKCGSSVRIDTTLLGFYHSKWQRGNRSYIFKGHEDGAVIMEVNHDSRKVFIEQMKVFPAHMMSVMVALSPSPEQVALRFAAPIVATYVDTEKIRFESLKSGLLHRKNSKTVLVNGYECRVYVANNVELVTKTRTEHLSETDKRKYKATRSAFQSFLGIMEVDERNNSMSVTGEVRSPNSGAVTPEEYFDSLVDLRGRDIGRPREVSTKIQKFKGTIWLCENYPISLQEQLIPIIDLMAISNRHFAKLRDFIMHQLPAGFPIKMEVPLFRVLQARVTFGNVFALDSPVPCVSPYKIDGCFACEIDTACFDVPENYVKFGNTSAKRSAEKPPQTAEAIAARRDERRQKILSKYGYSSFPTLPVTATSPSSMASSSISQAPPSTSTDASTLPEDTSPPESNRSWRSVARKLKLAFSKH